MSNNPHIVVVDGDHSILELFGEILHDTGYSTSLHLWPTLTPEEVEALNTKLIILDWSHHNEADTLHFVEQLDTYPPTSSIPIVICTAESPHYMWQYGDLLYAKAISVLYKPLMFDELSGTLTTHIAPNS